MRGIADDLVDDSPLGVSSSVHDLVRPRAKRTAVPLSSSTSGSRLPARPRASVRPARAASRPEASLDLAPRSRCSSGTRSAGRRPRPASAKRTPAPLPPAPGRSRAESAAWPGGARSRAEERTRPPRAPLRGATRSSSARVTGASASWRRSRPAALCPRGRHRPAGVAGTGGQILPRQLPHTSQQRDEQIAAGARARTRRSPARARPSHRVLPADRDEPLRRRRRHRRLTRIPGGIERSGGLAGSRRMVPRRPRHRLRTPVGIRSRRR